MAEKRNVANALGEIEKRLASDELLTDADRAQILEKARQHVAKKRHDDAEALALAHAIKEEERRFNPAEQFEDVVIDIAPYAPYIALDGTMYFHGLSYSLPYSVARTIDDVSGRTWEHQNEINGHRRRGDLVRRPQNRTIRPVDAPGSHVINTRQSLHENTQL